MKMKRSDKPVLLYEDSRPKLSDFTRRALCRRGIGGEVKGVVGWPEHWTSFIKFYRACILGDKIFYKQTEMLMLTFKDGKFFGNMHEELLNLACKALRREWAIQGIAPKILGIRKDLWKGVFSGKITNQEVLAKTFSRRYFKGAFTYKTLKAMYEPAGWNGVPCTLSDIFYYSTNPDLFLQILIAREPKNNDFIQLALDDLEYCRVLNVKINPKWSANRMREEHQKHVRLDNLKEIAEKNPENIAPPFSADGLSLILNEKDCFEEGLMMNNCVYRCYWPKVCRGHYLLAHGYVNKERITLGIEKWEDRIVLEQVHGQNNSWLSKEIEIACKDWIYKHCEDLLDTMDAIKKKNTLPNPPKEIIINDIPF